MHRRDFIVIGGSMAAGMTAGCSAIIPSQPDPPPPPDSEQWTPKPSVEGTVAPESDSELIVERHRFAIAGDDARIRGTVRNTGDTPRPVEITVELFLDEDGPAVAEAETEREALAPGDAWTFTVIVPNVDAPAITRYTVRTG